MVRYAVHAAKPRYEGHVRRVVSADGGVSSLADEGLLRSGQTVPFQQQVNTGSRARALELV